jgi:hypothetical protein
VLNNELLRIVSVVVVDSEGMLVWWGGWVRWSQTGRNCMRAPVVGHESDWLVTCEFALSLKVDVESVGVSDVVIGKHMNVGSSRGNSTGLCNVQPA